MTSDREGIHHNVGTRTPIRKGGGVGVLLLVLLGGCDAACGVPTETVLSCSATCRTTGVKSVTYSRCECWPAEVAK